MPRLPVASRPFAILAVIIALGVPRSIPVLAQGTASWKKHTINHRSPFEAVGVADFNGDEKPDVFCGDSWYAAPDWTQYKVVTAQ